jgi:hypothetical protein
MCHTPSILGYRLLCPDTLGLSYDRCIDHVKTNLIAIEKTFDTLYEQQGQGKLMNDFLKETGHNKTLILNLVNLQNQLRAELTTSDRRQALFISAKDPNYTKYEIGEKRSALTKNSEFIIGNLNKFASRAATQVKAPSG